MSISVLAYLGIMNYETPRSTRLSQPKDKAAFEKERKGRDLHEERSREYDVHESIAGRRTRISYKKNLWRVKKDSRVPECVSKWKKKGPARTEIAFP